MPENSKGADGPDNNQSPALENERQRSAPDKVGATVTDAKSDGGKPGAQAAGRPNLGGAPRNRPNLGAAKPDAKTSGGPATGRGGSGGEATTAAATAGAAGASGAASSANTPPGEPASPRARNFKKPVNHHDKFFKRIFSQTPFAKEFLRLFFPPANLSCFDLAALRIEKDAWANKLADLVLSLPLSSHLRASHLKIPHLKTAGNLLFVIVVEHKSHPDPQFLHKQLYYKTAVHEHILRSGRLSPVISGLFYHGMEPWGQPPGFLKGVWGDFFDKDLAFLKKFMIDYEVKIIDMHSPEVQKSFRAGNLRQSALF